MFITQVLFLHMCVDGYVCVMRGMQQSRGMNESYVWFMMAAGRAAVFSRFKRKDCACSSQQQSGVSRLSQLSSDVPSQEGEEVS